MTIEKLPSGSYRIRQMKDGQRYSLVLPYKPSKKEATELLAELMAGKPNVRKTLKECATEYIEGKKHTLSPSTVRGYLSIKKNLPKKLAEKPIGEITAWNIQTYIDGLVEDGKSPKTVRNYNAFLTAVFDAFCPDTNISTTLPQRRKFEAYTPSDEDVRRILDYAKGTTYEIPLKLATYGLRRSEICALTLADLDGNTLTINKALVEDGEHNWVVNPRRKRHKYRKYHISRNLMDKYGQFRK